MNPKKINLIKPNTPATTPNSLIDSLVDYEQHGKPIFGFIRKDLGGKYEVENEDGDFINLPLIRLNQYSRNIDSKSSNALKTFASSVKNGAAKIKLDSIWQRVDHNSIATWQNLLQLHSESASLIEEASFRVALLLDKIYFKRGDKGFSARSEDEINLAKTVVAENLKLESERLALQLALRRALRGETKISFPSAISDIETIAAQGKKSELSKKYITMLDALCADEKLCDHRIPIEEKAFLILVKVGHFNVNMNLAPIRLNRPILFSTEERDSAEKLFQSFRQKTFSDRQDISNCKIFTIDSSTTQDFDDAISLVETEIGFDLGVHITDVSESITIESSLESAAKRRGTSIYCPDETYPMLPTSLSEGVLSLKEGSKRPAISFLISLSKDYLIQKRSVQVTTISVSKRLSYDEVDRCLEGKISLNDQDLLFKFKEITEALEAARLDRGATSFLRRDLTPEIEKNGKIRLVSNTDDTPARKIVSELMILANETASLFAKENCIPFLYRSQEHPAEDIESSVSHIPEGPAREYGRRSKLKRSEVTTQSLSHFSLGLDAYCQITSPIRRYLDLVLIRQLNAFIKDKFIFYSQEALLSLKDSITPNLDEASIIQRERNRFWLLRYIEQLKTKTLSGTVVKLDGPRPLVELDGLTAIFSFNLHSNDRKQNNLKLGDHIELEITKLQPNKDKLHLKEISKGT